ncbi:hypothetical protein [Sinorhizobium meliloti]|nr:hypothetical protein [Sinorhizobium meliloti]WQO37503.1 hypothetical protein U8C34_06570 [Sinorhizobium meliloti]WQO77973.1 hypothetical protein U8C44_06560 [Sinorhizobium meliloti]
MNRDPAFAASFSAGASPARCVVACSGTQAGMTARLLFGRYHGTALIGEQLLDDEAERGVRTWTSPTEIARLLLMRRVPMTISPGYEPRGFRVLGAIIPDLDDVVAADLRSLPTAANPMLPLHLRSALLAGVSISSGLDQ